MVAKAQTLQNVKSDPGFQALVTAAGRVLRILPEKKISDKISKPLLKLKEEKVLLEKIMFAKKLFEEADIESKTYYGDLINHLQTLVEPVHSFFEKVMVMDKNVKVRNNRLALLKQAGDLFLKVGDFRKLVYSSETSAAAHS